MLINNKETPTLWPYRQIHLGLDLQGGMHLLLEVDTEEAVKNELERISREILEAVREERIRNIKIEVVKGPKLVCTLKDESKLEKFETLLKERFVNLNIISGPIGDDDLVVEAQLVGDEIDRVKKRAAEKALMKIRNRVDEYGVREPEIRPQGDNQIIVRLPGIVDEDKAKAEIGRTGHLEFKLVDDTNDVNQALNGNTPPGRELLYQKIKNKETQQVERKIPYLLRKRTLLTGDYLTDARVMIDSQYNRPYVSIKFNKKGAKEFAKITEKNVNRRLAIVLDNEVYSAPVIEERIPGGEARITGNFTDESAKNLALVLREAFPAPVKILYEKTIGPSLGSDSIRLGLLSMYIGGILVILFMVIYYKGAGLIADMALILNILLIAGGLAAFGATLTLPGIAGIILTIGMAVDANVLIFERIREELTLGRTPRAAIDAGYNRATLTILDANVTTLIAAAVLFQFGTGPVKGFAVTLSLGVIASMFTALIVSRMIFNYISMSRKIKTLSI
jgi:preprotein translocase subunit SecD